MRYASVVALLLALVACREPAPEDGAVRVLVKYGSYKPGCLRISARDGQGMQAEMDIPRSQFKKTELREVTVAVYRKPEWGRELTMEVRVYDASTGEASCSGSLLETQASAPVTVPERDIVPVELALRVKDNDGDGHVVKVDGVAGTDCDDERNDVRPGAPEACDERVDFDCDGAKGCADSDCQGKACNDGDACTSGEQCGADNRCTPTSRVECNSPPNVDCYPLQGMCNPSTGQCQYTAFPVGTGCNDNNGCTQDDQCGASARCAGTPRACTTPPNTVCYESTGQCTAGQCAYPLKLGPVSCDDGVACTANDQCDAQGICAGTQLPPCTPQPCYRSLQACAPPGSCMEEVDPAKVNTACTVGAVNGTCRASGRCSSFPFDPSNFDPDSIPSNEVSDVFRVSCGGDMEPVIFNSSTLAWSRPNGCTIATPTAKVRTLADGAEVAVVPVRGFIIEATHVLRLEGSRPVIFAVYGDATLSGALFANGRLDEPGAGGNRPGCGNQQGGNGGYASSEGSGGGGGGFGTAGGAGGRSQSNEAGGAAGVAQPTTLVPLVGGCSGGLGGRAVGSVNGGGGGGAVQVSVSGTLRVEHWVSVSGGGGRGGPSAVLNEPAGGGGGSGGGLLLEASHLQLSSGARLTANGGGGGQGASVNHGGDDGEDGARSSGAPAGGGSAGNAGQDGGRGGAEGYAAGTGAGGSADQEGSGGGGGGVGVIRARGISSCTIDSSCSATDGNGCDTSPKVTPECPP